VDLPAVTIAVSGTTPFNNGDVNMKINEEPACSAKLATAKVCRMSWLEKHRPTELTQFEGNEDVASKFKKWLQHAGEIDSYLLGAFLEGRCRSGKTSLVLTTTKECGLEVTVISFAHSSTSNTLHTMWNT
jgi:Holliday junction resolvasome RuvABC ATP-dependent DNA helicase subunit